MNCLSECELISHIVTCPVKALRFEGEGVVMLCEIEGGGGVHSHLRPCHVPDVSVTFNEFVPQNDIKKDV